MENEDLMKVDIHKWERKILISFCIIILIVALAELISFFVRDYNGQLTADYGLAMSVIIPSSINAAILLITYFIYSYTLKKAPWLTQYIIILIPSLIAINISIFHSRVSTIYTSLIFPVVLSVIFFKRRITVSALLFNSTAFVILFFNNPHDRIRNDFSILLVYIAAQVIAFTSSYFTVVRGNELARKLIDSKETEQELKVRTILMEKISKVEPATGLYNHITFHEYLGELINQSDIFSFQIHLALLDIDNFKSINDTFGHRIGDKAILAIAEVLKRHIGSNDFVSRYGGEEFSVIFAEKDTCQVNELLETIRKEIENIHISEMGDQKITVSIGISQYEKNLGKQKLFDMADSALYQAKRKGKNRICNGCGKEVPCCKDISQETLKEIAVNKDT